MIEIPYEALKIWFDMAQYKPSPEQETLHRELLKPHVGDEGPLPTMVVLFGGEQSGKAAPLDQVVPTPSGWATMESLSPGDEVFNELGEICHVVGKSPIWRDRDIYEVTFTDGSSVRVDGKHEWLAKNYSARKHGFSAKIWETEKMAEKVLWPAPNNGRLFGNWSIKAGESLNLQDAELPLPPYVLGAWLGDGTSIAGQITTGDHEIIEEFQRLGYTVTKHKSPYAYGVFGLITKLKQLGVCGNKHIPQLYLRSSTEQRLELLRGLMDTDGYCKANSGCCEFYNTNKQLVDDVRELLFSLGIQPSIRSKAAKLNGVAYGTVWTISFTSKYKVFKIQRKLERQHTRMLREDRGNRYIRSIEKVAVGDTVCIEVDSPSHLFLIGEGMVPTHNSYSCGNHVFARWMTDPLIWLVGDRYEDARREYEYCRDSAALCGKAVLKKASYSETGPWELEYTNGHKVKVLASDDVPKLAREAPDGIVMCEPGRQSYEAFRALWRRALPKTAWFAVAGTLEASLGSSRWYGDLYRELQAKNPYGGVGLSLPSYANRSLYPLGKDDPKFKSAVKSVRESNPVDGEEEVGERFLGIPRTPKGLVFSEFSRQIHVSEHADFNPDLEVQLWVDPGYDHAYAILWVQKAGEITNICDEFYLNHMVNDEVLTLVENHPMFPNVTRVVIDVAAKQHAGAQSSAYEAWCSRIGVRGIPIAGQRVEVLEGIIRTHDKLRVSPMTRLPYLRVHPRCRKTIWEFEEGYRLRERRNGDIGSDLPIDKNNDAMKAIAYGIIDNFGYSDIRHPLPKATTVKHSYDRNNRFRRSSYLSR